MARRGVLLGSAFLLAATAMATSAGLERGRSEPHAGQELMYFPSGELLRPLAIGSSLTLADLLWLRAIQYYGEHRLTDNRFPLAGHVFETITQLDPHFAEAYIFGGLVLAAEGRDVERGLRLLRAGMASNPERWDLAFETGFIYYIAVKDDAQAARFFERARRLPGAPSIVTRFAAHVRSRTGNDEAALALWEELLRTSSHPVLRELAERKVSALKRELGSSQAVPKPPARAGSI